MMLLKNNNLGRVLLILAYRTKSVCGFFKLIPINWKFRGHMELIPDNGIAHWGKILSGRLFRIILR